MRKIIYLTLFLITTLSFSQTKNCKYDFEEKTDSTSIKILPEKLIYERVFGNSKEFVQFTLMNNNGVPMIEVMQLQKSSIFIPANCFNSKSKIILQLMNGKIITLLSATNDACSSLSFDTTEKSNIRTLTGHFVFTKTHYEELKKSPVSLMRIQFVGENKDYTIKSELVSEVLKETCHPSTILMDYLKCIE